jgi:TatD DNase family protein
MLVDTHAHLEMVRFDADRDAVLERARRAGVSAIITIASNFESNDQAEAVAEAYPEVYHTVGVHPHDAQSLSAERLKELCLRALGEKVVAWGEIGLDFYRDLSPRPLQREAFREQLRCAKRLGLPVVIHNRDAHKATLKILEQENVGHEVGGVFHCFSGDGDYARRCLDLGFYLSIAGPITYPKNDQYRKLVGELPTDRLLIETDSPFLAPQAHRGRRNEPAYVGLVAEAVALATGLSVEDVARITAKNVWRLFGVGPWEQEPKLVYPIRDSLYINLTHLCTNACTFCSRAFDPVVRGHNLRLEREPSVEEIIRDLEPALGGSREVVFCGYGEPTLRLDELKVLARWLKERRCRVRLNTNGQGSLIHDRNIAVELEGLVDACSVSLNAQDSETYETLCKPTHGQAAFGSVKGFISEAKAAGMEVTSTVVDVPYWVDVEACRRLSEEELGVPLRVRRYNEVG